MNDWTGKKSIDTILFDLDGTLLHVTQDAFISAYFRELKKVFVRLGMDTDKATEALWAGTGAMVANDGSVPNSSRFWAVFSAMTGLTEEKRSEAERTLEGFYANEFHGVKAAAQPSEIPGRLVRAMSARGYRVVLATNPLFPACGIETRLAWIGLVPDDFYYISDYANSSYCKPNLGYYEEILSKINTSAERCIMVGNSPGEDMCAMALGIETYLVTDCLENEKGLDTDAFRKGSLAELETFLMELPEIRA